VNSGVSKHVHIRTVLLYCKQSTNSVAKPYRYYAVAKQADTPYLAAATYPVCVYVCSYAHGYHMLCVNGRSNGRIQNSLSSTHLPTRISSSSSKLGSVSAAALRALVEAAYACKPPCFAGLQLMDSNCPAQQ
jgi:hypothetical protein